MCHCDIINWRHMRNLFSSQATTGSTFVVKSLERRYRNLCLQLRTWKLLIALTWLGTMKALHPHKGVGGWLRAASSKAKCWTTCCHNQKLFMTIPPNSAFAGAKNACISIRWNGLCCCQLSHPRKQSSSQCPGCSRTYYFRLVVWINTPEIKAFVFCCTDRKCRC